MIEKVKFSCGHEADIQLPDNEAAKTKKINDLQNKGLCPECYNTHLVETDKKNAVGCVCARISKAKYKRDFKDCKKRKTGYPKEEDFVYAFVPYERIAAAAVYNIAKHRNISYGDAFKLVAQNIKEYFVKSDISPESFFGESNMEIKNPTTQSQIGMTGDPPAPEIGKFENETHEINEPVSQPEVSDEASKKESMEVAEDATTSSAETDVAQDVAQSVEKTIDKKESSDVKTSQIKGEEEMDKLTKFFNSAKPVDTPEPVHKTSAEDLLNKFFTGKTIDDITPPEELPDTQSPEKTDEDITELFNNENNNGNNDDFDPYA